MKSVGNTEGKASVGPVKFTNRKEKRKIMMILAYVRLKLNLPVLQRVRYTRHCSEQWGHSLGLGTGQTL